MSTAVQRRATPRTMRVPRLTEAAAYARHVGWGHALRRAAYVGINQAVTVSIFECRVLRREHMPRDFPATTAGAGGRFLRADEIAGLAGQLGDEMVVELQSAAGRGDEIYAVFEGDRIANIACHAAGPAPLLNDLEVHFDPPSIYTYRNFTPPPCRGRRLHAAGLLGAAAEFFARGAPQMIALCERTNHPAAISLQRMGWKRAGHIWRVGLGPWNHLGRSAKAAAARLSLGLPPKPAAGGTAGTSLPA